MSQSQHKKRLLDRHTYPARTISTYSVVGAYIVDIYYNHLYAEAIKFKNSGKVATITEGYKHAIMAFISAIDSKSKTYKPQHYTKLLTGINEYFTLYTSYSTLTISDCIDKITREFVPDDYYASLDKDQKRNILRGVLTNVIKEFTKSTATEFIYSIIDNHEETANIELLKDKVIDLFILERESLYQKFLDSNVGKKAELVDKALATRMQQEIKTLLHEKIDLQHKCEEFDQLAKLRTDQLSEVVIKYKQLLAKNKGLTDELAMLKDKLKTQQHQSQYQSQPPKLQIQQQPPKSQIQSQPPQQPTLIQQSMQYENDELQEDYFENDETQQQEEAIEQPIVIETKAVEIVKPIVKNEPKIDHKNEPKAQQPKKPRKKHEERIEHVEQDEVVQNDDVIKSKFEQVDTRFTLGNEPSGLGDYI